jgi:hypothetical protein
MTEQETYHRRAQWDSDLATATVVGSGQSVPPQPAGSPWTADPVGPEPPLGFSVDAVPVVGTHAEMLRSLRRRR